MLTRAAPLLFTIALGFLLAGCGQSGGLYLPDANDKAAEDSAAADHDAAPASAVQDEEDEEENDDEASDVADQPPPAEEGVAP